MATFRLGVLAFQGDVLEHIAAAKRAMLNLNTEGEVLEVRTNSHLSGLSALVIPGGESTVLQKLCEREDMFEEIKRIKNIFGTCAGAILLAKKVNNSEADQRTLGIMDIEVDRNAYGRQMDSFEEDIESEFGKVHAIFIRSPRIRAIGKDVRVLAKKGNEILACEQRTAGKFYLACCFHPELTTTKFHEYFLTQVSR